MSPSKPRLLVIGSSNAELDVVVFNLKSIKKVLELSRWRAPYRAQMKLMERLPVCQ